MSDNKCFGCKNESLGYCYAHRDSEGAMTSIYGRTNACKSFVPKDSTEEGASKRPKIALGFDESILSKVVLVTFTLAIVALLINLV